MTPAEIKAEVNDLARKLVENGDALREMCSAIERLQKALELESQSQEKKIPNKFEQSKPRQDAR